MIVNKLFKRIIVILIINIMILPSFGNIVLSEWAPSPPASPPSSPPSGGGSGSGSGGSSDYTPSEPSTPSTPPVTTPTEPDDDPVVITIPYYEYHTYEDVYTSIEGIIWEDFNNEEKFVNIMGEEDEDNESGNISIGYWGNERYDSGLEWLIGGIDIKMFEGTTPVKTFESLDSGLTSSEPNNEYGIYNFKFDADSDSYKEYSLGFEFGVNNDYNYRYNAQDYSAYVENINSEIEVDQLFKGKGVTQVYLVVDFSTSMYLETTNDGVRRIDAMANSVKALIEELEDLPEEQNNLLIGIIAYAGSARIATHLTNNFESIKTIIYELVNRYTPDPPTGGPTPGLDISVTNEYGYLPESKIGTNISAAVQKATEGFMEIEDTNRLIILFSDGAPTVHNDFDQVYNTPEKESKWMQIAVRTNPDLRTIYDSEEYKLIPILIKSYDGPEASRVETAFNGIEKYTVEDNSDSIVNEVSEMIKEIIRPELLEDAYIFMGAEAYKSTADNEVRRLEVNNIFKNLYYGILRDFERIDHGIAPINPGSKDIPGSFISNTWMKTDQHPMEDGVIRPFAIKKLPDPNPLKIDHGSGIVSQTATLIVIAEEIVEWHHYVPRSHVLNFYLSRRQEFELNLTEYVTGVRITLSDGTVIHENILGKNSVKDIANKDLPYPIIIDELLLHGALVEIEYAIEIKNTTNTKASVFSVANYLDDAALVFNQDAKLLTNPEHSNKEYGWYKVYDWSQPYGWNQLEINTLQRTDAKGNTVPAGEGLIRIMNPGLERDFKDKYCLKADINNEPLNSGFSKTLRLVLTAVLDSAEDINFNYLNHSEIVGYANETIGENPFGRRMEKVTAIYAGMPEYAHLIAGNKGLNDVKENDEDISMVVQVMLPTGSK